MKKPRVPSSIFTWFPGLIRVLGGFNRAKMAPQENYIPNFARLCTNHWQWHMLADYFATRLAGFPPFIKLSWSRQIVVNFKWNWHKASVCLEPKLIPKSNLIFILWLVILIIPPDHFFVSCSVLGHIDNNINYTDTSDTATYLLSLWSDLYSIAIRSSFSFT